MTAHIEIVASEPVVGSQRLKLNVDGLTTGVEEARINLFYSDDCGSGFHRATIGLVEEERRSIVEMLADVLAGRDDPIQVNSQEIAVFRNGCVEVCWMLAEDGILPGARQTIMPACEVRQRAQSA